MSRLTGVVYQEAQFPPRKSSVGCRFGQQTFAATRGKGQDAPRNEPARAGGSARLDRRIFDEVMRGSA